MWKKILAMALVMVVLLSFNACTEKAINEELMPKEESAELQSRGNGSVELVTDLVHDGTFSAKLAIPEGYSFGEAARIAVTIDDMTLNDITSLSYWCYIDADTPVNPDGTYWIPYVTFEIDTDNEPGCDTWVIGGIGAIPQDSGVWFEITMENDWLFQVASNFSSYESPFPLSDMGTLSEINAATGPNGKTTLGDSVVSKIRLAIGNWGPGGPLGPVICHVDHLICNGEIYF